MNQNILSYNPDIPDPIHRQRNKQLYEDLKTIEQDLKQAAATGDFTGLEPRIQKAKQQAEALKQETIAHQEKVTLLLPEIARSLEKQAQPSYDALKLILTDLPASAKEQLNSLEPITPELYQSLLQEKFSQWASPENHTIHFLADRKERFNEEYILVAVPNVQLSPRVDGSLELPTTLNNEDNDQATAQDQEQQADTSPLQQFLQTFADKQTEPDGSPNPFYYSNLYALYSAQDLCGAPDTINLTAPLRFVLIPTTYTPELSGEYDPDTEAYNNNGLTVEQQRQTLSGLQHTQPNLACPTTLEAMCYWYGLRARGHSLNTNTTFNQTYIRHFGLEAKLLDGFPLLPYSFVYDDGELFLDYSSVADEVDGRWSMG